jgi:alkanesulfonate monooxygenase SsuD/methylene tetrahydromethanopterin reductase-like flavin-dependent oxidoreductase (luciferase family)
MAATLDGLSNGRVDLGVRTGWSRVEFRRSASSTSTKPAAALINEALEVMTRCWRGGEISHDGDFFSFRYIDFEPVPLQQPSIPIWVGGASASALRRAARFARTWHPNDLTPEEVRAKGQQLDELAGREVNRSLRLAVTAEQVDGLPERIDAYGAVGCQRVVIDFRSQSAGVVAQLAEKAAARLFG